MMMSGVFTSEVRTDDARPAGRPEECFYCHAPMGSNHRGDCVILDGRRFCAMASGVWHPIDTYIDGENVLFWLPEGEQGIPAIESCRAYWEGGQLSAWTHGGPNAGSDFVFHSQPTHWMKWPEGPGE